MNYLIPILVLTVYNILKNYLLFVVHVTNLIFCFPHYVFFLKTKILPQKHYYIRYSDYNFSKTVKFGFLLFFFNYTKISFGGKTWTLYSVFTMF